jgi:hypothetical protein
MRDITLEDTVYFRFTTRAFSTGVPTTLGGTPALSVLESNNATPITAGVSLSVDRASVTGLNEATVVATAANGYEVGKSYALYISAGTVGGTSVVGEVVAEFTIQASAAAVDLANATDGLGALKGYVDGIESTLGAAGAGLTALGDTRLANLDATVSSRLATAGYTAPDNASIAAILIDTAEIGVAGAGLTVLASAADLANVAGYIDTEIVAIKAKTDNLPASPAATGDIPTAIDIADAILARDIGSGTGAGALDERTVRSALRAIRNKWGVVGTTYTVRKEDDVTTAWTATLTTDASGVPITGSDPA